MLLDLAAYRLASLRYHVGLLGVEGDQEHRRDEELFEFLGADIQVPLLERGL